MHGLLEGRMEKGKDICSLDLLIKAVFLEM